MPTVSAHVAQTLARHVDHVFGVMGNGNAHFLDALERSTDVQYTAMRHEAGGVVAADATAHQHVHVDIVQIQGAAFGGGLAAGGVDQGADALGGGGGHE